MIYALADGLNLVEQRHLKAACALWKYGRDTVRCYLGGEKETLSAINVVFRLLKDGVVLACGLEAAKAEGFSPSKCDGIFVAVVALGFESVFRQSMQYLAVP